MTNANHSKGRSLSMVVVSNRVKFVLLLNLSPRILKAKYYPNVDVLKARAGNNPSYTWRSIVKGIEVLNRGIIWRVGDGSSINIWSDPWLPRLWSRLPITPRGQTVLTKVEELINPITEWWDEELIRDVFWPEDVEVILSTPVHISLEDTLAWHFDNKGIFSVRSAYRVQRDHERRSCCRGAASSSGGSRAGSVQWKSLWKMGCPGKIRHFL